MTEAKRRSIEYGSLYVHIDEDGNAISVAKHGGEAGSWHGISIAKMAVPGPERTREELNSLAAQFAAAPKMLAALERIVDHDIDRPGISYDSLEQVIRSAVAEARAAIAEATGGES